VAPVAQAEELARHAATPHEAGGEDHEEGGPYNMHVRADPTLYAQMNERRGERASEGPKSSALLIYGSNQSS
jgi:hypothetical protein